MDPPVGSPPSGGGQVLLPPRPGYASGLDEPGDAPAAEMPGGVPLPPPPPPPPLPPGLAAEADNLVRPDDKPRFDSVLLVDVPRQPARDPLPPANEVPLPPPPPPGSADATQAPPRPSLGFIAFDDGSAYSLDFDYIVGREPGRDERVLSGAARELAIDDTGRTVSRVHAEIRVEGTEVMVIDRGSTNGTFLWDDTTRAWTRLTPAYPARIVPGMRGAFGQRTFVYDSPPAS